MTASRSRRRKEAEIGICILAGGLSRRMGRNKAAICIGGLTLLQRIRKTAEELELPIRVIRRDRVPRCGPLGGIYTGLITSRAGGELFLACDMPFVEAHFLGKVIARFKKNGRPVFTRIKGVAGFPLVIPTAQDATVLQRIEAQELSIQSLASALPAVFINVKAGDAHQFRNLNSPGDLKLVRQAIRHATIRENRSKTPFQD